jgi:hypothetical protein
MCGEQSVAVYAASWWGQVLRPCQKMENRMDKERDVFDLTPNSYSGKKYISATYETLAFSPADG